MKKPYDRLHFVIKRGKVVKLVIAVIAVMLLSGILSGLIIANVRSIYEASSTISSVGTFKAIDIGVYWDQGLTRSVNALDWGPLAPGTQKSFTVYVCNEGTLPLTLSISTSNWSPSTASNFMTFTWSYTRQTINVGTTIPVTLTLTVSTSITGISNFNFDITAVGTYAK